MFFIKDSEVKGQKYFLYHQANKFEAHHWIRNFLDDSFEEITSGQIQPWRLFLYVDEFTTKETNDNFKNYSQVTYLWSLFFVLHINFLEHFIGLLSYEYLIIRADVLSEGFEGKVKEFLRGCLDDGI